MHIVHSISDLRAALSGRGRPAFVPTMGNLHAGHLALMQQATQHVAQHGGVAVASIFVNPLQFLPHEDFGSYPRTWEADCAQLHAAGCQVLFAPREHDLYPEAQTFKVHPDAQLADILEGQFRPGFFVGVCTVVMKLFACVFSGAAGSAMFGRKDYQQLMVIRRMVQQFALPIEIVAVDTQRADDGLALSSRNGGLSSAERMEAVQLYQALRSLAQATAQTKPNDWERLEAQATQALRARGWQPDYLTVRQRSNLLPPTGGATPGTLVALGAARLGNTRLIDSLEC